MSNNKDVISFMDVVDQELWEKIEPDGPSYSTPKGLRCLSPRKEKEPEREAPLEDKKQKTKQEKCEYKREERNKKGQLPTNNIFSFTSFLIPICITGDENADHELLYCICALKNALKFTSTTLRKEGFAQLYMVGMKSKINWKQVKSNKVSFSDVISAFLIKSGTVCMIAANNKETIRKEKNPAAPFVVLLTAADKKIPCEGKLCVGASWIVFRRSAESRLILYDREVFNYSRQAITAGICINGCATTIITAFQNTGLHRFIFDIRVGDFLMYQEHTLNHPRGYALSLNEGLFAKFTPSIKNWLTEKKKCKGEIKEYYSRYTGGCLTDGYIIMITGGLYLSLEDVESLQGRPSLLFEAVPLAYLAEKAGGLATNGKLSILEVKTDKINQVTRLFLGSIGDVEEAMDIVNEVSSLD